MKLVAITGISKESISDLKRRHLLTFEFYSANNVVAFSDMTIGDMVFLTDATPSDLTEGLCGVIAVVKTFETRMQHTFYGSSSYAEETETMSARAQLSNSSTGKIRSVGEIKFYKPILVDVIEVKYCEAK
jgi:uncharacterized protein